MRSLTLRKAAIAAALPLAIGSLAACGNNDGPSTAADPQAPASSAPTGHASQAAHAGSAVSSSDFLSLVKAAGRKITTAKVAMTGDASGQVFTMKGALDLTRDKPTMQMTMDMASAGLEGIEMRLVDGAMYMSMGQLTNGKFVKFDLSDPNSPLGSMASTLDNLDPAQLLGRMSPDSFRHVTYVGTDHIGRHYRATLVTGKSTQLEGLPSSATANLPKTMAYDVWLDDEGRFVRFQALVPKTMKLTATYSDYGTEVHVTAPDPSQVTDMPLGSAAG